MTEVAVVILNYNGQKFLKQFLPGVLTYLPDYAKVIVIDNNSSDQSINILKNDFPEVELIILEENTGFTGGYNNGLQKVQAKYYVLLNSDIEIKSSWIEPIYELMESDEQIAICQPKILDQKKNDSFEYAGAAGGYIDYLGYPFCRGRVFQELETDDGQYNDIHDIFWCTGAAMFVRAEVYHELGGLDSDFFAHMEEIDFCWRTQLSGRKIKYVGQSAVYHVGGGTLPKNNPRKAYLNFRNNLVMLVKNWPRKWLFTKLFWRLCLDGIAGVKFFVEGDFQQTKAVIQAHFYIYRNWRSIWRKRRNNPFPKDALPETTYSKSIVWQHYVKGKSKFSELD